MKRLNVTEIKARLKCLDVQCNYGQGKLILTKGSRVIGSGDGETLDKAIDSAVVRLTIWAKVVQMPEITAYKLAERGNIDVYNRRPWMVRLNTPDLRYDAVGVYTVPLVPGLRQRVFEAEETRVNFVDPLISWVTANPDSDAGKLYAERAKLIAAMDAEGLMGIRGEFKRMESDPAGYVAGDLG